MSTKCDKDDESVIILKNLITSVMKDSNYFDEDHQYERMNDLDKVACILKQLIPIVREMSGDSENYVISKKNRDALVDMINFTKEMKPFGI